MFELKRENLKSAVERLGNINRQKEVTIDMLEERRKKDEEKYLKSVLEKETICKQEIEEKKKELIDAFFRELDGLESVGFSKEIMSDVDELLALLFQWSQWRHCATCHI